jgi:hypothetical protein
MSDQLFSGVRFTWKNKTVEAAVDEHNGAIVFRDSNWVNDDDLAWEYLRPLSDFLDPLFVNELHKRTENLAPVDIYENEIDWLSLETNFDWSTLPLSPYHPRSA